VAFSPGGQTLAAGLANGTVELWNLADPARPARLGQPQTSPAAAVNSVAFSPDGRTLAAGIAGGTVELWNLADPARPARLGQPLTSPAGTVNSVAFSPDGRTIVAGIAAGFSANTADGTVEVWNLNVDDAIQRICAATSNTMTAAQWNQYISQLPYNPPCAHPGRYGLLSH
jgi:WD40 repeat protein